MRYALWLCLVLLFFSCGKKKTTDYVDDSALEIEETHPQPQAAEIVYNIIDSPCETERPKRRTWKNGNKEFAITITQVCLEDHALKDTFNRADGSWEILTYSNNKFNVKLTLDGEPEKHYTITKDLLADSSALQFYNSSTFSDLDIDLPSYNPEGPSVLLHTYFGEPDTDNALIAKIRVHYAKGVSFEGFVEEDWD